VKTKQADKQQTGQTRAQFPSGNPDTFSACIEGILFGAVNKIPFQCANQSWPRDGQLIWITGQIIFHRSLLERMIRFKELLEAEANNE
jgi:hypothetical protein